MSYNPFINAYKAGIIKSEQIVQQDFNKILKKIISQLEHDYTSKEVTVYRYISKELEKYLKSQNITVRSAYSGNSMAMLREGPAYIINFSKYLGISHLIEKAKEHFEIKIEKEIEKILNVYKQPYNHGKSDFVYYGSLNSKTLEHLVSQYGLTYTYYPGNQREPSPVYNFKINM